MSSSEVGECFGIIKDFHNAGEFSTLHYQGLQEELFFLMREGTFVAITGAMGRPRNRPGNNSSRFVFKGTIEGIL